MTKIVIFEVFEGGQREYRISPRHCTVRIRGSKNGVFQGFWDFTPYFHPYDRQGVLLGGPICPRNHGSGGGGVRARLGTPATAYIP